MEEERKTFDAFIRLRQSQSSFNEQSLINLSLYLSLNPSIWQYCHLIDLCPVECGHFLWTPHWDTFAFGRSNRIASLIAIHYWLFILNLFHSLPLLSSSHNCSSLPFLLSLFHSFTGFTVFFWNWLKNEN